MHAGIQINWRRHKTRAKGNRMHAYMHTDFSLHVHVLRFGDRTASQVEKLRTAVQKAERDALEPEPWKCFWGAPNGPWQHGATRSWAQRNLGIESLVRAEMCVIGMFWMKLCQSDQMLVCPETLELLRSQTARSATSLSPRSFSPVTLQPKCYKSPLHANLNNPKPRTTKHHPKALTARRNRNLLTLILKP